MEIINLSRALPTDLISTIEAHIEKMANGKDYELNLGQVVIGSNYIPDSVAIELIIITSIEFWKTTKSIVFSSTRKQPYIKYRQTIAWLIHKYTDLSLQEIGEQLGGYTHATMINSIRVIRNYMRTDNSFKSDLIRLDERVQKAVLRGTNSNAI